MNRTAGLGFSMVVAGLLTVAGASIFAGDSQAASSATGNDKATRQLFQAVYANDLPQVQLSVGDGADVDARDRWGMTPAEIAIDRGNYRIAHFLVSIHNTRRTQGTPETPAAAPAAASKAESAAPVAAADRHPATATGPATTVARRATPAASPASASTPAPVQVMGPNPFDPATPAPGSQLSGATVSADSR